MGDDAVKRRDLPEMPPIQWILFGLGSAGGLTSMTFTLIEDEPSLVWSFLPVPCVIATCVANHLRRKQLEDFRYRNDDLLRKWGLVADDDTGKDA